jgi:hypothetical protein
MNYFYIASSIQNISYVRATILDLELALPNWLCVYDWSRQVVGNTSTPEARSKLIKQELEAIKNINALIVLPPLGRGAHVEIGAALVLNKPVYFIGEKDMTCLAYDLCENVENIEVLIERLKSIIK